MPAPSPRTKPSRALSNGRDAAAGSSVRFDNARMAAKPAMGRGWIAASAPPATTTSASPARRISRPIATASAPDAQALTGARTPARAPSARPTAAAGPFGMSMGTVCGPTRAGPFSFIVSYWASRVSTPPMPEPTTTASRSGSTPGSPASAQACRAATSAICWTRSKVRACTRSTSGSAASGAPMRTGRSAAHGASSVRTPDRPASSAAHVCSAVAPTGVVAPRPVTATPPVMPPPWRAG